MYTLVGILCETVIIVHACTHRNKVKPAASVFKVILFSPMQVLKMFAHN